MNFRPSTIGRVGWGFADQGLSSLTNFALTVLVANAISVSQFGIFSIIFAVYQLAALLGRGLTAEPLLVRFSSASCRDCRQAIRLASGTACALGGFVAVAAAGAGFIGDFAGTRATTVTFGLLLPGLLLQDHWRFAFLALGRPFQAFLNDALWMVLQLTAIATLGLTGDTSLLLLVLAWGGAGNLAALCGLLQIRLLPDVLGARRWLRDQRDLAGPYAAENLAGPGSTYVALFAAGALAGLPAAASLRVAQAAFGPFFTLAQGIQLAVLPEVARIAARAPQKLGSILVRLAISLALMAILWSAVVLSVPSGVGQHLFGPTWQLAQPLFGFFAISWIALAVGFGAFVGLRVLADARRSLRARLLVSSFTVVTGVVGAATDGARGVAIAAAVNGTASAGVWWASYRAGAKAALSSRASSGSRTTSPPTSPAR